jgi:hypothetical protein
VNHLDSPEACLFGSASIQLNAVPLHALVRSDLIESDAVSCAGIKHRTLLVRKSQEPADSLRLGYRKGIETQALTSC